MQVLNQFPSDSDSRNQTLQLASAVSVAVGSQIPQSKDWYSTSQENMVRIWSMMGGKAIDSSRIRKPEWRSVSSTPAKAWHRWEPPVIKTASAPTASVYEAATIQSWDIERIDAAIHEMASLEASSNHLFKAFAKPLESQPATARMALVEQVEAETASRTRVDIAPHIQIQDAHETTDVFFSGLLNEVEAFVEEVEILAAEKENLSYATVELQLVEEQIQFSNQSEISFENSPVISLLDDTSDEQEEYAHSTFVLEMEEILSGAQFEIAAIFETFDTLSDQDSLFAPLMVYGVEQHITNIVPSAPQMVVGFEHHNANFAPVAPQMIVGFEHHNAKIVQTAQLLQGSTVENSVFSPWGSVIGGEPNPQTNHLDSCPPTKPNLPSTPISACSSDIRDEFQAPEDPTLDDSGAFDELFAKTIGLVTRHTLARQRPAQSGFRHSTTILSRSVHHQWRS